MMMVSTAVLEETGLQTSDPETQWLLEASLSTVPSLFAQPIKMSPLTQQVPALFKALGQGMGVVLTWLGFGPPCLPSSFPFLCHTWTL